MTPSHHRAADILPLVLVVKPSPTGLRWGITGGWLRDTTFIGSYEQTVEVAEDLLLLRQAAPDVFLQGSRYRIAERRVLQYFSVSL